MTSINEPQGLGLLEDIDVERQVREMLLSGWILVTGDADLISLLERQVYPPGTEKNRDFTLFFGSGLAQENGLCGLLFLARKNEDLRAFLKKFNQGNPISDERYELLVEVRLTRSGEYFCASCLSALNPLTVVEDITRIVRKMFQRKK